MKLLTESFQRNFVFKDFIYWFKLHSSAFYTLPIPPSPPTNQSKPKIDLKEVKKVEEIKEVKKVEEIKEIKKVEEEKESEVKDELPDPESEIEIAEYEDISIENPNEESTEHKTGKQKKRRNKSKK